MDPSFHDLADALAARMIRAFNQGDIKLPVATDWLTTEEAAEYLRSTPKALQHHRAVTTGPRYHKRGRFVRYRRSELDAWLESGHEVDAANA